MARKKKYESMTFDALAKKCHQYLQEDGLELNFEGYRHALRRYFQIQDHDIVEIHEVMIECNLWYNYFSEVKAFIDLKKEEWLLESDWLFAHEKKAEPSEDLEDRIQTAKLRTKQFGMFSKHLETQSKFFAKSSKHCLRLYKNASNRIVRL